MCLCEYISYYALMVLIIHTKHELNNMYIIKFSGPGYDLQSYSMG